MASSVSNVSVEIGEDVLVFGIAEENVVWSVGEGKCFEGIFNSLEPVENMQQSSFQILAARFFGWAGEEKGCHRTSEDGDR